MSDSVNPIFALHESIRLSPGMAHVNRSHARSFSFNIFLMNAQELVEIIRQVRDPEEGLRLWHIDNREANQQIHREVNRRVHNFVASSFTLVEHTRAFMRKYYANKPPFALYTDRVNIDFSELPVAKFVQCFRNYIVHKGLPSSDMFLDFMNDPDNPGNATSFTTGIRYRTVTLLEWDGWAAPAKAYIQAAGENLEIQTFVQDYLERVVNFHQWLNTELDKFHIDDISKIKSLQAELRKLTDYDGIPSDISEDTRSPATESSISIDAQTFELSTETSAAIVDIGNDILESVQKLDLADPQEAPFESSRPIAGTVLPVETPFLWTFDTNGRRVFAFIQREGYIFGLFEEDYIKFDLLGDLALSTEWIRKKISRNFIRDIAIRWCRESFRAKVPEHLPNVLSTASRNAVRHLEIWLPIAHFEIEIPFDFGPVRVAPLTTELIKSLERRIIGLAPEQESDTVKLFDKIRSEMQGLAAVVMHIDAETDRAAEEAESIARDAVGLLRFFSPGVSAAWVLCPVSLLGSEAIPLSKAIVFGPDSFRYSERCIPRNVGYWRMSQKRLIELRQLGLTEVGSLVVPDGLSDFSLAVRSSLLLYGTGATFSDLVNRLVHTLASLERLLLRHSAEPTEFTVSERMSRLLAQDRSAHEVVGYNVREAYRLRRRPGTGVLTPIEEASFATFLLNAHNVLSIALANIKSFDTKADFLDAVDRRT